MGTEESPAVEVGIIESESVKEALALITSVAFEAELSADIVDCASAWSVGTESTSESLSVDVAEVLSVDIAALLSVVVAELESDKAEAVELILSVDEVEETTSEDIDIVELVLSLAEAEEISLAESLVPSEGSKDATPAGLLTA